MPGHCTHKLGSSGSLDEAAAGIALSGQDMDGGGRQGKRRELVCVHQAHPHKLNLKIQEDVPTRCNIRNIVVLVTSLTAGTDNVYFVPWLLRDFSLS